MVLTLNTEQLQDLVQRLKDNIQYIQAYDEALALVNGEIQAVEFLVDQWPNFQVLIHKSDDKHPTKYGRDTTVKMWSTNDSALKEILDKMKILFVPKSVITVYTKPSVPVIRSFIENNGLSYHVRRQGIYLVCTKETFKPREVPNGFTIRPLVLEQSDMVNSYWELSVGEVSKLYIKHLIATKQSCALYTETNELVGWAVCYHYGWPGVLYVPMEHRGKGYAKIIMSKMIEQQLNIGKSKVFVWVEDKNMPSIKLHTGLGLAIVPDILTTFLEME